ncbi:MAG: transcriptional repressor [Spirochaetes bacterium]|nr:transcriptional repressor [Spirochaetota bacterium]
MSSAIEKFNEYVKNSGLKSSAQRNHILEIMESKHIHRTVEEIYDIVKKSNPEIGIATVYRTVKLLCEAGIAKEIHINHDVTRYEISSENSHHDHLICQNCGKFVEIESDTIEKEQAKIAAKYNFDLKDHCHILYGICGDCRKKTKKK